MVVTVADREVDGGKTRSWRKIVVVDIVLEGKQTSEEQQDWEDEGHAATQRLHDEAWKYVRLRGHRPKNDDENSQIKHAT